MTLKNYGEKTAENDDIRYSIDDEIDNNKKVLYNVDINKLPYRERQAFEKEAFRKYNENKSKGIYKKTDSLYTADTYIVYENIDESTVKMITRVYIEGNEELISGLEKDLNGINRNAKFTSEDIGVFRNRASNSDRNNANYEQRRKARRPNGIYSNESGERGRTKRGDDIKNSSGNIKETRSRSIDDRKYKIETPQDFKTADELEDENQADVESTEITQNNDKLNTFENRTYENVSNKYVGLVMNNYPQLKKHIIDVAKDMRMNLKNSIKGSRTYNSDAYYAKGDNAWQGTKRYTAEDIAILLDNKYGTYDSIDKTLGKIILNKDNNNSVLAKRIEFLLHDRLMKGYIDVDTGLKIPANEKYKKMYLDIIKKENSKKILDESDVSSKTRKVYTTAATTATITDYETKENLRREINEGNFRYEVSANKEAVKNANNTIISTSLDEQYNRIESKFEAGEYIDGRDIVIAERLIQEYTKKKDYEKVYKLLDTVAIVGTELGQAVQALSIIKRLSPEGQLIRIEKTIKRMNTNEAIMKQIKKTTNKQIELSEETKQAILNAKPESAEMDNALDRATREIAQQMPPTMADKIVAWRYLSMLCNVRTHGRNVVSNVAMQAMKSYSNTISALMQDVINPTEKTRTLKKAPKEFVNFAKKDAKIVESRLRNGGKESFTNKIMNYRRSFDNEWLQKGTEINSNALEAEDWLGLSKTYEKTLSNYMVANNLTIEFLTSGTKEADIQLEKARTFAIQEAHEATFRTFSKFASWLSRIENGSNGFWKVALGGVVPFKKTPINIAKSAARYSPIGLAGAVWDATYNVKTGKINASEAIDNLAKGLSGTSISLLGMLLAKLGLLVGADGEDRKYSSFEDYKGMQNYSLVFGNSTYTLDWLSPSACALFMGVETYNSMKKTDNFDLNNLIDGMVKTFDPIAEMSILSSLTSAVTSFTSNSSAGSIGDIGNNIAESYLGQFFPTLLGQLARSIDDTERETWYTDKIGTEAKLQRFLKRQIAKIPFLSFTLEEKVDTFGNTKKRTKNPFLRTAEQTLFPYYRKDIKNDSITKEIDSLYKQNGNSDVLPKKFEGKYTISGNEYKLTPKQYETFKKNYGQEVSKLIEEGMKSEDYKAMSVTEKEKYIKGVYDYSSEKMKGMYADDNKIEYEKSKIDKISNLNSEGVSTSVYNMYEALTKEYNANTEEPNRFEEYKILADMKITEKEKNSILKSYFKEDTEKQNKEKIEIAHIADLNTLDEYKKYISSIDKYEAIKKLGVDYSAYTKISKEANAIKENNSGTKKASEKNKIQIRELINSYDLSNQDKLLMYNLLGYSTSSYKSQIYSYINSLDISRDEKKKLYKYLGYN